MSKVNLLELRFYPIEGNQQRFKVSVEGFSGEVHYEPVLPFLDGEAPNLQDRRFTVVKILDSTKFDDKNFNEDEQAWMVREQLLLPDKKAFKPGYLATIGRRLYQILGQNIQEVVKSVVANAKRDRLWRKRYPAYRTLLHIRLRFPVDDTKYVRLTDYPWELLHNDYGFFAHQGVRFSRYIAYSSPRPNLPTLERLNVLLVSSSAGDERMGLEPLPSQERDVIKAALQHAQQEGVIQLETLDSPTFKTLRKWLIEHRNTSFPHVLHFDGHGFFGKRCNQPGCRKANKPKVKQSEVTQCEVCGAPLGEAQGYLVFELNGTADYVSARELGELLGNLQRREQPNSESGIVLVVLSACRSGMSRLSETVFNGVAQNLIGQGIPAVVAMQYSVSVDAAKEFAEYFYLSLGQKESLAIALGSGQSAMGIEGDQWYRPVLYLRWEDNDGGQLFKDSPVHDTTIQISPTSPVKPLKNPLSSIMILTMNNEQKKKLREALISAFPSKADLERMLEDELEISLNTVADGSNYTDIVFNLIKCFDSQGRTQDLINASSRANPGNPKLQEFIREIGLSNLNKGSESLSSSDSFQKLSSMKSSRQKLDLQGKIVDLQEEREACNSQYRSAIDEAQRIRLKRKLADLDKQIDDLERQLNDI